MIEFLWSLDPAMLLVVALCVIFGGLFFAVIWRDAVRWLRGWWKR